MGKEVQWEEDMNFDAVCPVLERASYQLIIPRTFSVSKAVVMITSDMWNTVVTLGEDGNEIIVKGQSPEETLGMIPFRFVEQGAIPKIAVTLDTLRRVLIALPSDGAVGSASFRFLFHAVRLGFLCFFSHNFVPDVVPVRVGNDGEGTGKHWTVIYRPFVSNAAVKKAMKRLSETYPVDEACVLFKDKSRGRNSPVHILPQDARAGSLQAICAILTLCVSTFAFKHKKWSKANPQRESLAFFYNKVYSPLSLQEHSNGIVAKRWLSVFNLLNLESEILLRLSESGQSGVFNLDLFLRPKGSSDAGALGAAEATSANVLSTKKKGKGLAVPEESGWHLPDAFLKHGGSKAMDTLRFLMALKEYLPEVNKLLKGGRAKIEQAMFELFVCEKAGVLAAIGVTYVLPRGIRSLVKPRLVTHLSMQDKPSSWKLQYLKFSSIVSFDYMVAIGDELVNLEEFHRMVESGRRLFRFKETYVQLDAKEVESILSAKGKEPKAPESSLELMCELMSGGSSFVSDEGVDELIADVRTVRDIDVPPSLDAKLRDYQIRGFQWMWNNVSKLGGCVLGDDMGLGKTIQVRERARNRSSVLHETFYYMSRLF